VTPRSGTVRVSVDSRGGQADRFVSTNGETPGSFEAAVSGSGRFVAFTSHATDLVARDTNGDRDVFVHDLVTGRTSLVSVANDGSQAAGRSGGPDLSADGRFVAFYSTASNLVPGTGHEEGDTDVYVRDRRRHTTVCLSCGIDTGVLPRLAYGASMSDDGNRVAFVAGASNAPRTYLYDRRDGTTELLSIGAEGMPFDSASVMLSRDGTTVTYGSGSHPTTRVWVRSVEAGTVHQVGPIGSVGGALSGDGALIAYSESVGVGAALLIAEVDSGRVIETYRGVGDPVFSADGRFVSVFGDADDISPIRGDPGGVQSVFLIDRSDRNIRRISVTPDGRPANDGAFFADLSADGRTVAYESSAADLVTGDTNQASDVFARKLPRQ
jgi:Tol biopolymer transport system component